MLQEVWGEWRLEPRRFLDAGDRVVVFARILGKGGTSGVPFGLWRQRTSEKIHAGRAASPARTGTAPKEALQAAGLSE